MTSMEWTRQTHCTEISENLFDICFKNLFNFTFLSISQIQVLFANVVFQNKKNIYICAQYNVKDLCFSKMCFNSELLSTKVQIENTKNTNDTKQ